MTGTARPERNRRKLLRVVAVLVWCFVALAGCGDSGGSAESDRPHDRDPLGKKLANQSDQLSDSDSEALERARDYSGEWNRAAAPLVRDYLDPDVSAEVWVANAKPLLARMAKAIRDLKLDAIGIQDPGVRRFQLKVVHNYEAKLGALYGLRIAVANGDVMGERKAARALDRATRAGERIAERVLQLVRPYYSDEEWERIKRERAGIVDRALEQ